MHLLEPKDTSFTYLVKRLGKEGAKGNYSFTWFEDEHPTQYITVNAATTAAATSVTVDSFAGARRQDIYRNERTGECIFISILGSTSTALDTVVRGYGGTAAAPMADGDILMRLGNASAEGQAAGDFVHTTEASNTNYIQEFRTPIILTERAIEAENYTGKDWPYQLNKAMKKHAMDIERQFLFGEPKSTTINTSTTGIIGSVGSDTAAPITATGGIVYWIKTNADSSRVWDVNGTLTEDDFIKKFLEPAFEFGSESKILFASTKLCMALGYWGWKMRQLNSGDKTMNLILDTVNTPIGELRLVRHRQLDAPHAASTGTVFKGSYGIVLDMKAPMKYKEMQATKKNVIYEPYTNDSGYSARKEEFVTKAGLKFPDANRHALIYGINAYA